MATVNNLEKFRKKRYYVENSNPAIISRETYAKVQEMLKSRGTSGKSKKAYPLTGIVKCPECGRFLKGHIQHEKTKNGKLIYKKYRCPLRHDNKRCSFPKAVSENVIERKLLAHIGDYLNDAKARETEIEDANAVEIPQYNIEEIHEQIDRLNYSWQTGKIRKVEQYEKDYAELMEKLEKAEAERGAVKVKDFSRIDEILQLGWRGIYKSLDDAHKRAFWRSFIQSIEINWTTETKEIVRVNFF